MEQRTARPNRLVLAAFAVIVLIGGTNFVAVRFSNQELPPFLGAAARFGAASLLLFVVAAFHRIPLPLGRALIGCALYGLLGFALSYAFTYWALIDVQAGLASVVLAMVPLITFFLAVAHGLESFRWPGLLGGLVSLGGIGLIFGEQLSTAVSLGPLLALVAAAICIAESTVAVKWFPRAHPVTTNAVAMAVGTAVLLPLSLFADERWIVPTQLSTWLALVHLVTIGSTLLFVLFVFVISRWTASASSYALVLFPLGAVPLGAWLARETVTATFLLGAALVLGGVYLGALAPFARPAAGPVDQSIPPKAEARSA